MLLVTILRRSVWPTLRETGRRWSQNQGTLLAAAMSYYMALSFFPLLLVLISGFGLALRYSIGVQNAQENLLALLAQNTAPTLADLVRKILSEVQTKASVGGPVAVVTLLLGAVGIFTQLDAAFDRLWQIRPSHRGIVGAMRNALWHRLRAFLILLCLAALTVAAFAASMFLVGLRAWASYLPVGHNGWAAVQWMAGIAFNTLVFSLLYKTIPKAPVGWRQAIAGGFAVAVAWYVGSQVLAYIVVARDYTAYGVVGSFIAVMLWVYCASCLLFLGGQLVQVMTNPEQNHTVGLP